MDTQLQSRNKNLLSIKNKRIIYTILIHVILAPTIPVFCLSGAMAGQVKSVTCLYELKLGKGNTGDITSIRTRNLDGTLDLQVDSNIMVSSWLGKQHMTYKDQATIDKTGLIKFDHKITEDDKTWWIFGEYHKNAFWCSARKLLSEEKKENDALVDLAVSGVTSAVPYAGQALTVINLLQGGNDDHGDLRISLDTFETTVTELPLYLFRNKETLKNKRVRVLDSAELKIWPGIFEYKGQKPLTLAGQHLSCEKFIATTKDGQITYWIAQDALGAFIARETGSNNDDSYEFQLKEYR